MRRVPLTLLLIAIASASGAEKLRVEKTDPVGRKIENEFYIADLSHRVMNGKEEDSGTLRGLTYKPFGVTFFRNPLNGRMHKGISLQRAGAPGYKDIGTWTPIQTFREEQKGGFYIHHREGYFADYPEVKLEVEYRFAENAPYFLVSAAMTVEKPLKVVLVRSNEMTMDLFFTHLAWPGRDGQQHIVTFDERRPLLEKEPMPADIPWLAFLNLEKGYGYGHILLDHNATKTVNAGTSISDGTLSRVELAAAQAKAATEGRTYNEHVTNGRYWSRHMISGRETDLEPGDQFKELSAYVLFRSSKDKPLAGFFDWQKKIKSKFGVSAASATASQ